MMEKVKSEKYKISEIKGKTLRYIIKLRYSLSCLLETEEERRNLREEFNNLIETLNQTYRSIVNPSIRSRDGKKILAWYWDEKEEWEYKIEVLKNKYPTKEGLKDYKGYAVVLDGTIEKGTTACELIGIDWGYGSAPKYLWDYLNKIADEKGVEEPER